MTDSAGDSRLEPAHELLGIEQIRSMLPHRYPMLLVDRVLELDPGKRAVGIKNVTANEPFCQGHFPNYAIMPGVLVLESMAQMAGVMMLSVPEHHGKMPYLCGIDRVRFRRPVVPGDTLRMEVALLWNRKAMGKVRITSHVGDDLTAEAEMMFALREWPFAAGGAAAAKRGDS
jgi:3-hydroxyacyl-[acyl-carrier-protein] dehydratase